MMDQQRRILVVDDDELVRDALQNILEQSGYLVTVAWDHPTASAALGQAGCDAVLLDCMMLGDAAKTIAGEAARLKIPVLLTSGHPDPISAQGKGSLMFIAKPFRVGELRAALTALFAREPAK